MTACSNIMPEYNPLQTWLWNLQNCPNVADLGSHPKLLGGEWNWCGIPVASPLGIPAGPLLNSGWLLYYASLGFDILVYKTVRSSATACYDLPNLVPVTTNPLRIPGGVVAEAATMDGSWAVSFGMPSVAPPNWRRDVEHTRRLLPEGKALVVSVVGTQDPTIAAAEASLTQLADDFAQCAKWAVDSGAHGVEANFSCPNVSTADGQLYQQPVAAGFVAQKIREQIGEAPLVLKIGYMATRLQCQAFVRHVAPFVSGLAMTNAISAQVQTKSGTLLFDSQQRGICGDSIRETSVEQVTMFAEVVAELGCKMDIIGVGGISCADHVKSYLTAGASSVGIATAAMTNPNVALGIRRSWQFTSV